MAGLTNKQKKEWAESLYLNNHLTQKEIAAKVGVSSNTVSNWVKKEKWEERKAGLTLSREAQLDNLYRQVVEINAAITGKKKGERYPTTKEADILSKLSASIKNMESDAGISEIISVGMRFIKWVRQVDVEKAKELTLLWDGFIMDNV